LLLAYTTFKNTSSTASKNRRIAIGHQKRPAY